MGTESSGGRNADVLDVPRAIAAINRVAAETQVNWLGNSPFGPWIKAVHD